MSRRLLLAGLVVATAAPWPAGAAGPQPRTSRVSVATGGRQASGPSGAAAVSADGRWVAFASDAADLVPGDTNRAADVFVRDRRTGTTSRVSVGPGRRQAGGPSELPAISGDGRHVAFVSAATDLVADDTNGFWDVFVYDRQTGTTTRVSVTSAGAQQHAPAATAEISLRAQRPAVSRDGRVVAFSSPADDLVSPDANGYRDVFVRDLAAGTTTRAGDPAFGGPSGSPAISADGRVVAFVSAADNLVPGAVTPGATTDVFVHDRTSGRTELATASGTRPPLRRNSSEPSLSADGRLVAFSSDADDLVTGDTNAVTDVFVRDRVTGTTTRVSRTASGGQAGGRSSAPAMSADGRTVAFVSEAADLVPGDTNGVPDVFVRDATTSRVGPGGEPTVGVQGRVVVFSSDAANLVAGDTNKARDVFAHERVGSPGLPPAAAPRLAAPLVAAPGPAALQPALVTVRPPAGRPVGVAYRLDLPPHARALDVVLLVNDRSGNRGWLHRWGGDNLTSGLHRLAETLARGGVDARFGLARYGGYDEPRPGSRYQRLRDLAPADEALRRLFPEVAAVAEPERRPPTNEPYLLALDQVATGAGLAVPVTGAAVPAGQAMTFRPGARHVVVLATDMPAVEPDPDAPSRAAMLESLRRNDVEVLGLDASRAARAAPPDERGDDFAAPALMESRHLLLDGQLRTLALDTAAVAGPAGLDCDGDGRPESAAGSPLVCEVGATAPDRVDAVTPLLGLLRDPPGASPLHVVVSAAPGVHATVSPTVVLARDLPTAHDLVLSIRCTSGAGTFAVRTTVLLGSTPVATATAHVVCGAAPATDGVAAATAPGTPPRMPPPPPALAAGVGAPTLPSSGDPASATTALTASVPAPEEDTAPLLVTAVAMVTAVAAALARRPDLSPRRAGSG